ncbi:MAG TPA: CHAT domain-containing protein [Bryobacteraceae bacterium]|nr:CHAT domain-containing protein [Bryobacteraceae bacterium]
METKAFDQALAYLDNATKLASTIPDAGYQFTAQELRAEALVGLKQLDAAERAANELLAHAREARRGSHEASALGLLADIAAARNDRKSALLILNQTIGLAKSGGYTRLLAGVYARAAEVYKQEGDLTDAESSAELAAESSQASGDLWAVPQRLVTLAGIEVARGDLAGADRVYDRAEAFVDSMIGNLSTAFEKTAVITASSQIYTEHFALVAGKLNDISKAYSIIEQVRGRVAADLLSAGLASQAGEEARERTISQLKLKLMAAKSTEDVRKLRDQIFMAEQAKWISPGADILRTKSRETIGIDQIRESLPASAVLLEYVIADPISYCLSISRTSVGIARLDSKARIEGLVASYLKAVKDKQPAVSEGRALYDAVLRPVREVGQKQTVVIVRDGQLHLVAFDALREPSGRYVVEARTILYSPSATTFYLLAQEGMKTRGAHKALLAVGGIPYARSPMNRAALTRGFSRSGFVDLPSSEDEVRVAQRAFPLRQSSLLLGRSATEAAFKREPLQEFQVIHLAVHAFADPTFPDRAALVLMSDPSTGEDGFLQASEVAQLRLDADLVVLSACDTAVGALNGQEGIANLSRAFLLAGARTVVSTLWEVDDSSSLFLMRHFYAHLGAHQLPAAALTAAKRDMLRTFGRKTLPAQWAAFTVEGQFGRSVVSSQGRSIE